MIFPWRPCILFFDSLRQATTNETERKLKNFLKTLHGNTGKPTIKFSRVDSPRQRNFIDCGAFMLYVIDKIARTNPSTRQELQECMKINEALSFRSVIKDALTIAYGICAEQN